VVLDQVLGDRQTRAGAAATAGVVSFTVGSRTASAAMLFITSESSVPAPIST